MMLSEQGGAEWRGHWLGMLYSGRLTPPATEGSDQPVPTPLAFHSLVFAGPDLHFKPIAFQPIPFEVCAGIQTFANCKSRLARLLLNV